MAKEEIEQTLNKEEPRSVSAAESRSMTVVGERSRTEPYELPEGWKWIALLDTFENKTSSQKKVPTNEYLNHGQYAIIDQGQEFIGGYTNDESKVFKDNLPVIIFGDHTRNIKFIDFPFAQGADGIKVLKPKDFLDAIFFYYGLKNIVFPDLGYRRHFPLFKNFYFPLPPTLAEQQRIVSRIESLFTKLDEAKDKAQSVVDGFELRRTAILHKAFTGELTAKWRASTSLSNQKTDGEHTRNVVGERSRTDGWKEVLFDSCIQKMQNGISKRSGSEGSETVVLRLANIGDSDFNVSDLRTIRLTEKEIENYTLKTNDVVMIRVNGSKSNVGRQILVSSDSGWSFCDHIIRIQFNENCLAKYMVYFSQTKRYRDYVLENMVSSAGQNTISRKGLSKLTLNLPTLPEQQEIVRILDSVLEKEADAKETAERVLEQIDLLKKSILARAFRGEL